MRQSIDAQANRFSIAALSYLQHKGFINMMRWIVMIVLLLLSSCATQEQQRTTTEGALIGAAAGAAIGAQHNRAAEGALLGGVLGAAAGAILSDPGSQAAPQRQARPRYQRTSGSSERYDREDERSNDDEEGDD